MIAHQGGQRDGHIAKVRTADLASYLVYDGPRWIGVYRLVDPPRTIVTRYGLAQVWEAVEG